MQKVEVMGKPICMILMQVYLEIYTMPFKKISNLV